MEQRFVGYKRPEPPPGACVSTLIAIAVYDAITLKINYSNVPAAVEKRAIAIQTAIGRQVTFFHMLDEFNYAPVQKY